MKEKKERKKSTSEKDKITKLRKTKENERQKFG